MSTLAAEALAGLAPGSGLHQAITQMLEDVGFVVESHSDIWDDPGYLFDAQNGYYDLHFLGWTGDWDDPGNFYGIHFAYSDGKPAVQFDCQAAPWHRPHEMPLIPPPRSAP